MECEVRSKTYGWHEEIMRLFMDAVSQREAATAMPDPNLAGTVRRAAKFLSEQDRPALLSTCRSAVSRFAGGGSVHREGLFAMRRPGRYERRRAEAIAEAVRDLSACVTYKIGEIVRARREERLNTYSVQPRQLEAVREVRDRRRARFMQCFVCLRTLAEHANGQWCRRPTRSAEADRPRTPLRPMSPPRDQQPPQGRAEAPFDTPAWNEFRRLFVAEVNAPERSTSAPQGDRRRARGARVGRGREGPTARWRPVQPTVAEEPEPEGSVKGSVRGSGANSDSGPEREPDGECEDKGRAHVDRRRAKGRGPREPRAFLWSCA